jgi:type IV secretory pathway VirB2 component (pilin)
MKKSILKYVYITSLLFIASPLFSADDEPPKLGGSNGLATLVDRVLGYLFPLAGLICLIFIIQGGYMWIISAGDPARVKQAQGTLTWAILGLVIVTIIFTILRAILDFIAK